MVERGSEKPQPILLFLFIASLIVGVSIIGLKKIMSKQSNETNEEKVVADASEKNSIIATEKEIENKVAAGMQEKVEPVKDGNDEDSDGDYDSDPDGDYEDDEDSIDEILDTPIKNNYTVSDGPFKMVLCVNMSLNMGKGKMCAQSGHATLGAYRIAERHCGTAITWWHRMGQVSWMVVLYFDQPIFSIFWISARNYFMTLLIQVFYSTTTLLLSLLLPLLYLATSIFLLSWIINICFVFFASRHST